MIIASDNSKSNNNNLVSDRICTNLQENIHQQNKQDISSIILFLIKTPTTISKITNMRVILFIGLIGLILGWIYSVVESPQQIQIIRRRKFFLPPPRRILQTNPTQQRIQTLIIIIIIIVQTLTQTPIITNQIILVIIIINNKSKTIMKILLLLYKKDIKN